MNRCESNWVVTNSLCVSPYIATDTRVVLEVAVPFGMACFPAALADEAAVGDWAAAVTWCMSHFVAFGALFPFLQPVAIVLIVLAPAPLARRTGWLRLHVPCPWTVSLHTIRATRWHGGEA